MKAISAERHGTGYLSEVGATDRARVRESWNQQCTLVACLAIVWAALWFLPDDFQILLSPFMLGITFITAVLAPPIALFNVSAMSFFGNAFFTLDDKGHWGKVSALVMAIGIGLRILQSEEYKLRLPKATWLLGFLLFGSILSGISNDQLGAVSGYLPLVLNIVTVLLVFNAVQEHYDVVVALAGIVGLGQISVLGALLTGNQELRLDQAMMAHFGGTNSLALFLAFATPFAVHFAFSRKTPFVRLWGGLSVAFLMLGLIWTASRGAAIASVVGMGALYVKGGLKGKHLLVLLVILAIVLLVLPEGVLDSALQRYGGRSQGSSISVLRRSFIYQTGLRLFLQRPIFGYGLGEGRYEIVKTAPLAFDQPDESVHNVYLQVALDFGAVGLVAFVGLVVAGFRGAGWLQKELPQNLSPDSRMIQGALLSAGVVMVVGSLFQGNFDSRVWYLAIGLLFAGGEVFRAGIESSANA